MKKSSQKVHLYSVSTCHTFWIFTRTLRYRYLTWKLRGSNRFFILYTVEPHSTDSHLTWTILVVPTKNSITYIFPYFIPLYTERDWRPHTLWRKVTSITETGHFCTVDFLYYYYFATKLYMLLATSLQWTLLCLSEQSILSLLLFLTSQNGNGD